MGRIDQSPPVLNSTTKLPRNIIIMPDLLRLDDSRYVHPAPGMVVHSPPHPLFGSKARKVGYLGGEEWDHRGRFSSVFFRHSLAGDWALRGEQIGYQPSDGFPMLHSIIQWSHFTCP